MDRLGISQKLRGGAASLGFVRQGPLKSKNGVDQSRYEYKPQGEPKAR